MTDRACLLVTHLGHWAAAVLGPIDFAFSLAVPRQSARLSTSMRRFLRGTQ
jgi:hypothetical protein